MRKTEHFGHCLTEEAAAGFSLFTARQTRGFVQGWFFKKKTKQSPLLLMGVSKGYNSVSAHVFPFGAGRILGEQESSVGKTNSYLSLPPSPGVAAAALRPARIIPQIKGGIGEKNV